MSEARRKWYRLVAVMCMGILLLGSLMARPALAQIQDNIPGSFLVFPIFDIIGANRTKIEITNRGGIGFPTIDLNVRVTYICQPLGSSTTSNFCQSFDQQFPITHNQTIVIDVGDQVSGACPTGQGYIVVWAEQQCTAAAPATCTTATGGTIRAGEFAPISYNQLFGSYDLFYNGGANPASLLCGVVPCSPPAVGPNPAEEAANAIAIQSLHPAFSFLGTDTGGALQLSFGTTTAFDFVALPRLVQTDFAAPGAALIAGPSTFPPFIPPDTQSGMELQTNIILLNLNYSQFAANPKVTLSVNAWNWFEVGFTSTHSFICWERIPINLIDARLTATGPFNAPYGNIQFTPSLLRAAPSNPSAGILGALEKVSTIGRTIRPIIHSLTAASPATFIVDIF